MLKISGDLPSSSTAPHPPIDCYLPPVDQRNGIGLIIFPGGGYRMHAEHEGKGYADFFVQAGICCFVAGYRLGSDGHHHPAMLEDALAAIHTVRQRASAWGIDPYKIGVMGSSAGGHLAAHAITAYAQYVGEVSLRADFAILCYPVITMTGVHCHSGSRDALLGENASATQTQAVSPEQLVNEQTPPCFLWHTWEDQAVPVENSLLFASALRASSVPFELHVYPKGRHGLGLNTELPWGRDCLRWIHEVVGG